MLLLVTVGGTVADLLAKIARGRIPAELLLSMIGLRTVDALTVLMPLAVFLSVLLAYGRLYRDSEMAVFSASGLSVVGLARPLLWLALPISIALSLISFWFAPSSVRLAQELLQEASRSLVVAGLEPGRFVELPGREGILYVGTMSSDGTHFEHLFVESERADKEGKQRIDVTTAERGELFHDANGNERYLGLQNGFRVEGVVGQDDYRLMRYARNDIKLPDNDVDENSDAAKRSAPTSELLRSNQSLQTAELHWRLAAPLSALVLMLLALPLSRSSPREPRYSRLLMAVFCWMIYFNCLSFGRSLLSQGKITAGLGLWWVHIPALLLAMTVFWFTQRVKKPRLAQRQGT